MAGLSLACPLPGRELLGVIGPSSPGLLHTYFLPEVLPGEGCSDLHPPLQLAQWA